MNNTATTIIRKALRPDVEAVVGRCVAEAPPESARDFARWYHYSQAKRAISGACGWHAPSGQSDQEQFDMAIQEYLRRVNL